MPGDLRQLGNSACFPIRKALNNLIASRYKHFWLNILLAVCCNALDYVQAEYPGGVFSVRDLLNSGFIISI